MVTTGVTSIKDLAWQINEDLQGGAANLTETGEYAATEADEEVHHPICATKSQENRVMVAINVLLALFDST